MTDPTKFSKSAANPAVETSRFPKTPEGQAAAAAFAEAKRAEGFRTQTTTAFGGRDMKTKQSFKVTVVHVFEDAEVRRQRQAEAEARWAAREGTAQ